MSSDAPQYSLPESWDRESLGEMVREAWVQACTRVYENPPPSWIKPWDQMSPQAQEVDRQMGEYFAHRLGLAAKISE